jgi:hypothetical protein
MGDLPQPLELPPGVMFLAAKQVPKDKIVIGWRLRPLHAIHRTD